MQTLPASVRPRSRVARRNASFPEDILSSGTLKLFSARVSALPTLLLSDFQSPVFSRGSSSPKSKVQGPRFEVEGGALDLGPWTLDSRCGSEGARLDLPFV